MISSNAHTRALPFSAWMRSRSSPCRSSTRSWYRSSTAARSRTGVSSQRAWAARARPTAAATSSAVPTGTSPIASPVSGDVTVIESRSAAGTATRAARRPVSARSGRRGGAGAAASVVSPTVVSLSIAAMGVTVPATTVHVRWTAVTAEPMPPAPEQIAADAPAWFRRALQVPVTDEWVEVDGARIHYLAWGEPGLPGMVFVHGGAAHAHWWTHVAAPFAGRLRIAAVGSKSGNKEIYVMDLDGHGVQPVTKNGAINLSNGGNIANGGQFLITADNTFNDAGSGGNFVNTGTLRKLTATGPTKARYGSISRAISTAS